MLGSPIQRDSSEKQFRGTVQTLSPGARYLCSAQFRLGSGFGYNRTMDINEKLDACGLTCPLPLLKAKQLLNKMEAGLVLEVVCTDPGSVRDFEVFASQSGNELLGQEETDGQYTHWIRKA